MIIEILMAVFGYFFKLIAWIAPKWNIWPRSIIDGFDYFGHILSKLNIIFPIDTLFLCINWFINFLVVYYSIRLVFMGINFFRGTGRIDVKQ